MSKSLKFSAFAPKTLAAVLAAAAGFGMSGCTGQEVAASIGAVAIGAGAVAIGVAAGSSGHYVCQPGYRNVCTNYPDYWGRPHPSCRPVADNCANQVWVRYQKIVSNETPFENLKKLQPSSADWAQTFGLSFESAETLTHALVAARSGDASGLEKLGLGHGDLRSLAQLRMPSEQGVDSLARSLDQQPDLTKSMLETLLAHGAEMRNDLCSQGKPGTPRMICAQ